eukprot:TRINITY_DN32958_c0_g1_i2.p1 TRINITY_DN32958_c0_g1~~TRINITY_DN32958_c0_g1_i2.p1  ORF type:complete len:281 (+),score=48.07 TRINITY_DN32958_c0_g1_i2:116-958(+)
MARRYQRRVCLVAACAFVLLLREAVLERLGGVPAAFLGQPSQRLCHGGSRWPPLLLRRVDGRLNGLRQTRRRAFQWQEASQDSQRVLLRKRFVREDWDAVLNEIRLAESTSVVVLCGVSHGGNLGAVLRTCALLGIPYVILLGGITRDSLDRALWSAQLRKRQDWVVTLALAPEELAVDAALAALRDDAQVEMVAVSAHGQESRDLWDTDLSSRRLAVIFGREKDGIPVEALPLLPKAVTIPMEVSGDKGSLNQAHSVSLVAYERRRQRHFLQQQDEVST